MDGGTWKAAVHGVAEGRTRRRDFTFTFHFHALEKEMATHSSVLAWRIPGTGEPGGLPSMGSHRVGHNWSDLAAAAASNIYSCIEMVNLHPHETSLSTRVQCLYTVSFAFDLRGWIFKIYSVSIFYPIPFNEIVSCVCNTVMLFFYSGIPKTPKWFFKFTSMSTSI